MSHRPVRLLSVVSFAALGAGLAQPLSAETGEGQSGNAQSAAPTLAVTAAVLQADGEEIIVTGTAEGYLALDIVRAAKTATPLLEEDG